MRYLINVKVTNILEVDAVSEDDAINKIKQQLISTGQMKMCDPVEFSVVEEVNE